MAQESRLVIVIDAKNAERNARNLGNELDSIERKGDFATKSMDALSVATRQLAGYMAGLVTVSAAISKMDTYTGLQNRLKLVTNNQVELNKATEDTFRIAQKTYSAWDSVLQVYQRFSDNAKTLNLTMDDTARLTETVSKAVAISGASAAAADAALVQFGQALASGTLRGEELNSVMEQTPALAKAIAQGMGITVGELRTVAAEGKITSQEIVKALRNVEKDVDALFAKTDITIGQSMTLLNNEITKFVGESGKGSGAAQVLAGTIQTLASNLDVLTSAMMVGGAYWLGTYIPAIYASGVAVAAKTKELAVQTVTQYAAIQAERAAAAQQVISTQAVVANTQATLAAIAAEKALEVQRLKSQISEKGRAATLTRMAELKKIEAQVTRELAVAEGALATAQARSAAAGAASVGIGSRLLGLLGGPVGIGITVASLAAGYLLMRDNGDKANDMLEKQSRYAGMAADELMKLEGAQKRAAEGELTKQLSLQNAQLSKSQNEFLLLTQSITDSNKQSAEAYRIWAELKTGVIDVNQAFNRLNQLSFISSDQINQLADSKKKVDENSKAVKQTNAELNQVRASGANAKAGFNDVSQGAKGAVQDVTELNKKLKDINKSLADRKWDADFKSVLITKYGRSAEEAELLLQTYRENQKKGFAGVTVEQDKIIKGIISQESALDNLVNKDKERTKELEKQQKVLSVNAKVQANAAKYGFAGIESKYNLPAGTLSALHMIESRGNAKAYNKSTGATGGFQFLEGTAKQYGVKDRTDLAQSAEGAGKYMSYLLKLFKGDLEKAVRAYHAGEGNVQKGKGIGKYNNQYWKDYQGYMAGINGYTAGDITSKDFDKLIQDATKMAEEQAKLRLQLENDVANEVTKIRNDLAKKLEDVDKANFTPERKAEIKAELQARADNDIAIAQQALKTKLDDYKQFNMTEEQLLKESFDRKKFNAAHDIELSKNQRDEAIKYLDQQYQQELGLLKLAQEQQLFQIQQNYLHESDAIAKRYELERKKIEEIRDAKIRAGLLNASARAEDNEYESRRRDAFQNYQAMSASMSGVQEYYNLDKELEGRRKTIDDALKWNNISEEEARQANLAAEKDYLLKRVKLNSYYGEQIAGSMVGMLEAAGDKQSAIYKAMFTANKAFAIAQSLVSIQQGIAQASANPFPYNLAAMASVAAATASIVGNIQSVAGIFHGGKDYVPKEATYLLDKGERVVSPRQNQDLTSFLASQREMNQYNAINSNPTNGSATVLEPIVNVYVMEGQTADVTRNDDGSLDVRIRQIAGEVAEQVFLQGIQNPNSRISKAFKQNYNATPRRQ
ncbi:tape measure protein [Acinetobacter baumannii]|uniref:tape measure protein n=2 Tax=Acinetobacter baumannii TaxID=470 RepID=UPI00044F71CA|nr:tape measure protein [Acinetobacter baumannii]EXB42670.1 tape measure domain protein [Acinetobacter baumannii 1461963]OTL46877.1 phage tail tape measure protein [Acinetobacter baumannii]OTN25462.1 phage tail tape measure protein [Acinetobacter baumannii]OTU15362.1 phage tail tape measure protein [Acinetobacter baumannii]HEM6657611.1 tape measure protein [Acinetobacter baumannii]